MKRGEAEGGGAEGDGRSRGPMGRRKGWPVGGGGIGSLIQREEEKELQVEAGEGFWGVTMCGGSRPC